MGELFQMWALVEVLGIMCLPLTVTVFHNLPDRGWAFSKAISIALLTFCVWLPLMYVHALPFSQLFIAGVLLILLALNILGFLRVRHSIAKLLRVNVFYIVACEVIFLGMVFLLGWIRSYGPDIRSFEMFMDEGFLAAILRSPHFPPNDMWLAGYPINYYYYAHLTVAVLAKLLWQPPSIAFNTGICMFFGLTAVNLFGVTCNIVSWARYLHTKRVGAGTDERRPQAVAPVVQTDSQPERPDTVHPPLLRAIPYGLLTILMAQVLGNLAATQTWWKQHGDLSPFYWFDASRVVDKTINEFPAFSFLLSCFHAHVLALAFTIVAIGLAFNLFLEPDGKGLQVFGRGWRLPFTLGITALILGGLFTMNGWDYPTYLGLTLVCLALQQWLAYQSRFSLGLLLDLFTAGAGLTSLSFLLYAPFYLNFISPSQGIGIVDPANRSTLGSEVLIYGMFAFIFFSLVAASALRRPLLADKSAMGAIMDVDKIVGQSLADKSAVGAKELIRAPQAPLRPLRLSDKGEATRVDGELQRTLAAWEQRLSREALSVGLIVAAGVLALLILKNSLTFVVAGSFAALGAVTLLRHLRERPRAFTLLLGTLAFALVAGCEIFFLRDVFADNFPRMNTVFKFYFQSWALLSITCGAGLFFVLEGFRPAPIVPRVQYWLQRSSGVLWSIALLILLLASTVYPLVATSQRTNNYAQRSNSLDGLAYMQYYSPGDYDAIRWLNSHVSGDPVIVEAIGPDYSDYGRISAFTGLPTIMGWVGHEYQWRVNWFNKDLNELDFSRRGGDVDMIYTDAHPAIVLSLMARYHAEYLYVGPLEQAKYPAVDLHRFSAFMPVVYSAKDVTIYKVP